MTDEMIEEIAGECGADLARHEWENHWVLQVWEPDAGSLLTAYIDPPLKENLTGFCRTTLGGRTERPDADSYTYGEDDPVFRAEAVLYDILTALEAERG